MSSILVKLPNWMGDILFSYNVLYTLSQNFDRIGLCTSSQHAELFEVFPIPRSEIIDYPPENWPYLDRETIMKIERFQPDIGLLLPNSFGAALAFRYAGIGHLYGYDSEKRGFLLERSMSVPAHKIHQTDYFSQLLKLFDLSAMEYPLMKPDSREKRILIHPGASKPPRAWSVDQFVRTAEGLKDRGYEVTFVSGESINTSPFFTIVRPTLKEFASLLRKSSLFIGNDSGPLHLAQQCGVPVVGIYGPGDPMITGPRSISPGKTVYKGFPCSPCRQKFFKECDPAPSGKPFCIETIAVQEVLKAASELLV